MVTPGCCRKDNFYMLLPSCLQWGSTRLSQPDPGSLQENKFSDVSCLVSHAWIFRQPCMKLLSAKHKPTVSLARISCQPYSTRTSWQSCMALLTALRGPAFSLHWPAVRFALPSCYSCTDLLPILHGPAVSLALICCQCWIDLLSVFHTPAESLHRHVADLELTFYQPCINMLSALHPPTSNLYQCASALYQLYIMQDLLLAFLLWALDRNAVSLPSNKARFRCQLSNNIMSA